MSSARRIFAISIAVAAVLALLGMVSASMPALTSWWGLGLVGFVTTAVLLLIFGRGAPTPPGGEKAKRPSAAQTETATTTTAPVSDEMDMADMSPEQIVAQLGTDFDSFGSEGKTRTPGRRVTADNMEELQQLVDQEKMLRQFSEALNFTINFDAMLWLVYTHCQDALHPRDFLIYLSDAQTEQLYTAFHVANGERQQDQEGRRAVPADRRVEQVIEIGQVYQHQDPKGRYWLTAPLNAGADTVGALQASHTNLDSPFTADQEELFDLLAYRTASAIDHWQTNKSLQIRAQQLQTLNEVVHTMNSIQEVQPLLELILDKAIELLDVEAGSFLLVDEDTGDLEFKTVRGPASESLVGTRLPFGRGIAGEVAQSNQSIIINDVEDASQWFSGVDAENDFHTHAVLTVPMAHQRQMLGVLQVINRRSGAPFTAADELLLSAFAGEAAVALQNARLLQQTDEALQQRVRELTLLQDIDRDLNQDLNVNNTVRHAVNWMTRLYDATAGAVVLFDDDGKMLANELYGYEHDYMDERNAGEQDAYPGIMGHVMKTGEAHVTGDVTQVPFYAPASSGTLSQMTIPIKHENRVIGAVAIESNQRNVYGPKQLEAAGTIVSHITASLVNALLHHQVISANRAKSEFISVVSHELKTPLTSIRGYADLMLSGLTGELSDQQENFLETVTANVARMFRLIQDLTDVSRIDTGQLSVNPEPIPITNVVSETISSIQSLVTEKDIDVHLDLLSDPPLVNGDHARLVQVLTNLVSNACKYSPRGSDIYVSLTNSNGEVKCSVRDTGYGMSQEDQDNLFTKFFRSENPDIRKAPGTGLGLSITRALVELHDGEMGFESELGEGSTFWFTVPVVEDN